MQVVRLGREAYTTTLERQRELAARRARGELEDTLLLVEHDPVFTLGRSRRSATNLLAPGDTPVVQVERGGDVTWHGPGQLVAYPIFLLRRDERDVHEMLRRLEKAIIAVLAELGVEAGRRPKFTGVWTSGKKIASLGIAVTGTWVTLHGLALNVSCDLAQFARINPCGLNAEVMTSVVALGQDPPQWSALEDRLASHIARCCHRKRTPPATAASAT